MKFLIEYWPLLIVLVAAVSVAAVYVKKFTQLPTEEQVKNVKEWLLYAVTLAEKEFADGGMGKLKLRSVYEQFLINFPWLAQVITFAQFSLMVDEALEQMKHMLETNKNISAFVNKGE